MRALIAVVLMFIVSGGVRAAGVDCISCHSEKAAVKDSVHGSLSCTGCHSDIKAFPHPDKVARVNCASCHSGSAAALGHSVHAASGGPTCVSCHGDGACHSRRRRTRSRQPMRRICRAPAAPAMGMRSWPSAWDCRKSIRCTWIRFTDSLSHKDGLLVAANCSSCHGSHDILSNKDPKSKTNRANIPATCGTCHAGPLQAFSSGIHGQMLQAGSATRRSARIAILRMRSLKSAARSGK